MTDIELMPRLTNVFRQVFDDDQLTLSRSMVAEDVEAWDSLTHINLIVAIEREFKLKFTTREISTLKNVGDLMDLITRKSS